MRRATMPPSSSSLSPEPRSSIGRPDTPSLHLEFRSPIRDREWNSHCFLGVWAPKRRLHIHTKDHGDARAGDCWFLLGASEPGSGSRIHSPSGGHIAVAFDGYVVDPPLHQRSGPDRIADFWTRNRSKRINGNFSAAVIDERAVELTLRTDAFGFSPLYYRVLESLVLFGTCADFLTDSNTIADLTGLASVLNHGFIAGDNTLFSDIHRVPLGGCLTFDQYLVRSTRRLDLEVAGTGDQPLTPGRMDQLNDLFHQAVDRCLALEYGEPVIALSSGFDSRRILGCMLDSGSRPSALTARVYQVGNRDLDATFGSRIAQSCGLSHTILNPPDADTYATDNDLRRRALGAETPMHDWALTLQRAYPREPAVIFKGFLGGMLHESHYIWPGIFTDPVIDIERIAQLFAQTPMAKILAPVMDQRSQIIAIVRDHLDAYAALPHAADLAWMTLRNRRATSAGSQLVQPRHLEVRPFLDLDYIKAALDIQPVEKLGTDIRETLLKRYHPGLGHFAGSGIRPETLPPVVNTGFRARDTAYIARIARDIPWLTQHARIAPLLSPRARILVALTRAAPASTARWHWAVRPVLEAVLHPDRTASVWAFR